MFDTEGSRVSPLPVQKEFQNGCGSRTFDEIPGSILSLFQGNTLYLIWVIVEEYLGCQCS